MADVLVMGVIAVILVLAVRYIVKAKKSGAKCIGCPDGCSCAAKENNDSGCSCGCHTKD